MPRPAPTQRPRPALTTARAALWGILLWAAAPALAAQAQERPAAAPEPPRFFVSTSAFMIMNAILEEPPDFYQLNLGWRLGEDDALLLEAITWKYQNPLGIPSWDDGYERASTAFPGFIRDWGVGVAWQHFWWQGLFSTLHATPLVHSYYDRDGARLATGFMLFVVARGGYHFAFWDETLFVEPSVAVTAWPIQTNMPADFRREDAKWPRYFLFEPGLNVGWNF